MNTLVIIPARGGSKGVPGKNIRLLGGKPLLTYTLEAARAVFSDEMICVSTDDAEIAGVARDAGMEVPFLRPAALSSDTAGTYEVLLHALDHYASLGIMPDTVLLLQPTSPFRTSSHIREALHQFNRNAEMLVGVCHTRANPYFVLYKEKPDGTLEKFSPERFSRRQDCPVVYEINGAIYLIRTDALRAGPMNSYTRVDKYVMDEISSHDIDTPLDWLVAEAILKQGFLSPSN